MAVAPVSHLRPVRPTWTHRHPLVFLAAFVVASEAVGLLGAWITVRGPVSYSHLARPTYAPPAWAFAPIWFVLAAATGAAAWLVWRHHRTWQRDVALRWWVLQLVLHAAWIPLFLGGGQPVVALIELSVLAVVAAITAVRFLPFDRRASALFLPYLLWIGFALLLNGAIVAMN